MSLERCSAAMPAPPRRGSAVVVWLVLVSATAAAPTAGCELLAYVRGERSVQAPALASESHADDHDERGAPADDDRSVEFGADDVGACADQGCGGNPRAALYRLDAAPNEQVGEHAAADGGHDTDEERRDVGQVVEQRLFHADHCEQAV